MEADEEIIIDKKSKKGKKVIMNKQDKANGDSEEIEPAVKKGKKKKGEDHLEEISSKKIKKDDELNENIDDDEISNESEEKAELVPTGKGRKKPKKEITSKAKEVEDKQKPAPKGRKHEVEEKAQDKIEEEEEKTEDIKQDIEQNSGELIKGNQDGKLLNIKNKKKNQLKSSKEKTEPIAVDSDEKSEEIYEEEGLKESKHKKAGKGKKSKGKKRTPKDYNVEQDDHDEEQASKIDKVGDEENENEEEVSKAKPKGRRGIKKAVEVSIEKEEDHDLVEPSHKRQKKVADEKVGDAKKKAPPKNKAVTNYEDVNFSNSSTNELGKAWNFKIASWNVDGIRAWMTKGGLDYITYEKPDILCLQEVKCSQAKLPEEVLNIPGYHAYWLCSEQDGYAGIGIYTTKMAIHVDYGLQNEDLDREGRIITAEYEQFYLVCTYVPNAGRKLVTLPKRLTWNEEFRKYVKELDKKKPVIICGDMNVAHNEIDLTNPKSNKRNAGFTEEERTGMTELLSDGFIDTYRHLYPNKTGAYTFWTYMMNSRAKNVGCCNHDPNEASKSLQTQLNATNAWLTKWRMKASAPKFYHITFTLRRGAFPQVNLGSDILPQST
ncbi:Recombination repair protein 1 [Eumeta japonica]|uniref:DNA-(apurinic or apyrimidinic site) endonuclease n=1 Tax=Eumeta variegata TaxID=151549 RepID=A0A4C1SYH7_EUMVA|nr:Recombination repair protein 1 [Eumeta japonica]